jgi:SAM-dependent methyltransferase
MATTASCAACGARELHVKLTVQRAGGDDALIPSTDRYGRAPGNIVRCASCGHMQAEPMPEREQLAEGYADAASEAYIDEEEGQRETARRALERIEAHALRRGSLLDLGCWVGFLLAEARDRGWRTLGVEPSRFAGAFAREGLGLEVIIGDLLGTPLPEGSFDAVTMGDVIEHLPEPHEALHRIRVSMTPSGVLWLALPDAGSRLARAMGRYWWSVLPTHVQYFTRRSIVTLLARSGFEVLELATAPKAFTVRYYLERVGGYWPPLARALVRAAGTAGVADHLWAPDFRDRMTVIARVR